MRPHLPDPALDQLLFVIALVKGVITALVLGCVVWRMQQRTPARQTAGYVVGVVAMLGGTMLLLARTTLGLVPLLFDGGAALVVLTALTDAPLLTRLAQRFQSFNALRVRRTGVRRESVRPRSAVGLRQHRS